MSGFNPSIGTPCWIEICATDVARATEFYSSVFNWSFHDHQDTEKYPADRISMFSMPDKKACPGGGIVKVEEGCHKSNQGSVSLYLFVDDLGKYIKKIEVAGGKKMDEVEPEGDMGLMQHFEDTEGNYFGLYALQKKDK